MLFSNNNRFVKVSLLITALTILCCYSNWEGNRQAVTVEKYLSNPSQYAQKEIILDDHIQVTAVFKDRFEISQDGTKMMIIGTVAGLVPHDFISLKAISDRHGRLTLQESSIQKLRKEKTIISLCAVIFVILLFFKNYRFSLKKYSFMERISCQT